MSNFLRVFGLWILAASLSSAFSRPPAGGEARPADGIYDSTSVITPAGRSALVREMQSIRESSGLDMMVVVIDLNGEWEPQALAEDLANRWGYHGGRALVLWVREKGPENPWIAVSGMVRSELSGAKLEAIVQRARTRAGTDARPEEAIKRAIVSLGEDLRFAAGGAARKVEQAAKTPRIRAIDALMILIQNGKKLAVFALAGLAIVVVSIYLFFRIIFKMRMALIPRKFPDVSWKRRFGAPHGGIVYTSASRKKRQHPHEIP